MAAAHLISFHQTWSLCLAALRRSAESLTASRRNAESLAASRARGGEFWRGDSESNQ